MLRYPPAPRPRPRPRPAPAPPTLPVRAQGSEVEEEAHSLIEGALRSVRKDLPGGQAAGAPLPTPPGGGNPLYDDDTPSAATAAESDPVSGAGSEESSGGGEDLVTNFQRNSAALRKEMLELRRSLEIVDASSGGEEEEGLGGAGAPSQGTGVLGEYTTILSDMKHRYTVAEEGAEEGRGAAGGRSPPSRARHGQPTAAPLAPSSGAALDGSTLAGKAPSSTSGGDVWLTSSDGATSGGDDDPPPAHSPAPGLASSGVRRLNHLLRDNGFGGLGDGGSALALAEKLDEVLLQYDRRGKLVQELLASADLEKQRASQLEGEVKRAKSERNSARREAAQAANRYESDLERSFDSTRSAGAHERKLRSEKGEWQKKVSQLEHSLRAREADLQKLKDKAFERQKREDRRAARDKEIYEKLKRATSRQTAGQISGAVRELRPAEIVGIYEVQREALDARATELEADNRTMRQQLGEARAYIKNMDESGGWDTPDEGAILNKLTMAERSAAKAAARAAEHEASALEIRQEYERKLAEKERARENLAEEISSLIFELESRPSLREFQSARKQIDVLEKQLHSQAEELISGPAEPEPAPENAPVSVKQKAKRDREVYRLQLHRAEKIPHTALVHLVQDACVRLDLSDPFALPAAVAKLLRVVAAVPRMENFIGSVCEVVLREGTVHLPHDVAFAPEPSHVPAVLGLWLEKLSALRGLQKLRRAVVEELGKRPVGPGGDEANDASVVEAIRGLVEVERDYGLLRSNYDSAEKLLRSEPDELLARIVAHFQKVFGCPDIDGVFSSINQLYLVNTECRNFLQSLRTLLGLEANAGVNSCLSRVRQLLDMQLRLMGGPEGAAREADGGAVFAAGAQLAPRLLEVLGLEDPDAILPAVEKLNSQMGRFEKALPQYQKVIDRLCTELELDSIDSIVPAVQEAMAKTA